VPSDGQRAQLSGQKRKASAAERAERAERKRTRNNLFKPVRKHQRCGTCQTCLNPRMKKACLTVRAKQEQELGKGGRGGQPHHQQQQRGGAASCGGGGALSAQEQAVERLQPLLDRWGKLEPLKVPEFVQQLSGVTPRMYTIYLAIITGSSTDVLRSLAHSDALGTLKSWLVAAQQKQKFDRMLAIIHALECIPVDREALQRSQIGRALTEIRKSCKEDARVPTAAGQLIAKWKEAVLGDRCAPPRLGWAGLRAAAAAPHMARHRSCCMRAGPWQQAGARLCPRPPAPSSSP
jgi:hypothetical protein